MSEKITPEKLEYMKTAMADHLREAGYSDEDIQKATARLREIEVARAESGSYKQARGIFNWQEGDEPAEDTIRRLRNDET